VVSRDYIQRTMARESADCDVYFSNPDEAAKERPEAEAERHGMRQAMKVRAVDVLAHRARELESSPLRLPPFRPLEELLVVWREWLRPAFERIAHRLQTLTVRGTRVARA
jgi:hypothetical protein